MINPEHGLQAQTIMPDLENLDGLASRLVVSFVNTEPGGRVRDDVDPWTSGTPIEEIPYGTWDITLTAYSASDVIATGTATGVVVDAASVPVTIELTPTTDSTGTLEYTVNFPGDEADDVTVILEPWDGGTDIVLNAGSDYTVDFATGTLEIMASGIDSGAYLLRIQLTDTTTTGDGTHAPIASIVQIYDNLVSADDPLNITLAQLRSPPEVPENLTPTQTDLTPTAGLSWTDISTTEEGFRVYRDGTQLGGDLGPNVTAFTDTTANANDPYTYEVRAFNAFGESAPVELSGVKWISGFEQSTPADSAVNVPVYPSFVFTSGSGADDYTLFVVDDDSGTVEYSEPSYTPGSQISTSLNPLTTYRWYIEATNSSVTVTTNERTFTTDVAPGVTVTPNTVSATEGGATGSYTVVLESEPTADVDIGLSSGAEVSTTPTSLTFTDANWDTPQTVTVTAVDDAVAEGAHTDAVTHTAVSTDTDYNGITISDVSVDITDNDAAGVSVTPLTVTATEGGADGTYQVVLTTAPTDDVNIALASGGEATPTPTALTFTTANWDTAQTVTVGAVNDAIAEGVHNDTITHAATSGDGGYDGIAVSDVTVDITDNDTAGVSVTATTVSATEGGPNGSYDVVLESEPIANVDIALSTGGEATPTPTALTFTTANWDTAQTVTVGAVDDAIAEGVHGDTITHTVSSTDGDYSVATVSDVTVAITDNDTAGVFLTSTSVSATEGGANGTYDVVLESEPTASVDITLSLGSEVSATPGTLTFTDTNWDMAQTVTVAAVDDGVIEGGHTGTVSHAATSGDGDYNGITISEVTVNITDNDGSLNIYALQTDLVYRFDDMTGSNQKTYDGSGPLGAGTPFSNGLSDMYVDASYIYVTNPNGGGTLYRFDNNMDMDGTNQEEYGGISNVYGVSAYGGQLYTGSLAPSIQRQNDIFDTSPVSYDGSLGTTFSDAIDITVSAAGIYVVDFNNDLLYRLDDISGAGQEEYDGGVTPFNNPRNVAVDSTGRIYVTDLTNGILYRFDDMTGANQVTYDGAAGTTFGNPGGLAIDSLDRIYVSDNSTNRIYRFDDMTGTNQVELPLTGVSEVFVTGP